MPPQALSLAPSGRWLALTALTLVTVGLAVGQPILMALGLVPVIGLLWAMAAASSLLYRVRAGSVSLACGGEVGAIRIGVERTSELNLALLGVDRPALDAPSLRLVSSGGLQTETRREGEGWSVRLRARRVGYDWIQGGHLEAQVAGGLVTLRVWLPVNAQVSVLPQRFPLSGGGLRTTRPSVQERAGVGRSRRRGFGLELRELREHRPGDSFKHIAWAASARRGHLVTREFESDTMVSAWLLVDVSPSMFWGQPGSARIDFALDAAFGLASCLSSRGDRVGVMLYDERVRSAVAPERGRGQSARVLEVLLEAPHLLHEDRTEVTERELMERIARWFEVQEQRSFQLPWSDAVGMRDSAMLMDDRGLHEAVMEHLEAQRAARPTGRFTVAPSEYARAERQASYRAFCRHVGIPLPLDPTPNTGGQARGLEAAVQYVLRQGGGPHTLVVISDLYSAEDLAPLRRAAIGARRYRHNLMVLCPSDPGFVVETTSQEPGELNEALESVARIQAAQSLATVEAALRPAGVTIVSCAPDDAMPRVLQHLDHVA